MMRGFHPALDCISFSFFFLIYFSFQQPAAVAGDRHRAAEVDLSGRHLERLPTSLFSSLHLTSINLSHNLLTPTPCSTSRRRQAGRARRRRERRRRQLHPECRETSSSRLRLPGGGDDAPHQADNKSIQLGDDDGLSVDSGLPSDPVDEEIHKGDQKAQKFNFGRNTKSLKSESWSELQTAPSTASGPPPEAKPSQVWESIAEELQAKLRFRKAKIEGLALEDEGVASTSVTARPAASGARGPPRRPSLPEVVTNTVGGEKQQGRSEGRVGNEQSSSSGVDESESGSEASSEEEEEARGSVRRACPSRTLGGLHHLRHFQQLQVGHHYCFYI